MNALDIFPSSQHEVSIKKAIRPFLEAGRLGKCIRIFEGAKPENSQVAYTEGRACRLILVLSGTGKFLTVERGQDSVFEVERTQSVFLAPNTWISCIPRESYKSLGIIFGQNFLRVTITRRTVKRGEVELDYLAKHSLSRMLRLNEQQLLQLLQQPAPESLRERYVRYLLELIVNLVWDALSEPRMEQAQGHDLWEAMREYVMEHWSEADLCRTRLADHFHVHPNHVSRIFKMYGRVKYIEFLNEVRLSRSLELLESSSYSVTDIAVLCGYTDLQYFIRCFRERFGMTPGVFRKGASQTVGERESGCS